MAGHRSRKGAPTNKQTPHTQLGVQGQGRHRGVQLRQVPDLPWLSGLSIQLLDHYPEFMPEAVKINWSPGKRTPINIPMERLWRTDKIEEVYLRAYSDGWEEEIRLARLFCRYGHVSRHSSLGSLTPHEVYTETNPCSSRPRLTMSGRICPIRAIHLSLWPGHVYPDSGMLLFTLQEFPIRTYLRLLN